MKSERLELVRGSGNVFRDLEHKNADAEQFKAILAAEIIRALDLERLSGRVAHDRSGIAAADFSRIRNADLARFTVDRLMSIINRLGSRIEVKVRLRPVNPWPNLRLARPVEQVTQHGEPKPHESAEVDEQTAHRLRQNGPRLSMDDRHGSMPFLS